MAEGGKRKRFTRNGDDSGRKRAGNDRSKNRLREKDEEWEKKRKSFTWRPIKTRPKSTSPKKSAKMKPDDGKIRLNKFIANAGICSRREADKLIEQGVITVNGKTITELGFKIEAGDDVRYAGQRLKGETPRYVLLNKPKDFITTSKDPKNRKTVMQLVENACRERIYPVGRLDRNTTGVLLFTNDGDLAKRLTHPSHNIKKLYHVVLNKSLKSSDFEQIVNGLELEDGPIKVDEISYVGEKKSEVGVEIHSGKNRIVRRIFEHLGYEVTRLDRVVFAGLTKKDIPRGKWKHLSEKDLAMLRMMKY